MSESGRRVEPVAIVGIGCRLPGGATIPNRSGRCWSRGAAGSARYLPTVGTSPFYHPDPAAAGGMVMRWGGFVDQVDGFDAAILRHLAPRSGAHGPAATLAARSRLGGDRGRGQCPRASLRGRRTGVFVGISGNDYGDLQLRSTEDVDAYTNSGSTASIAPTASRTCSTCAAPASRSTPPARRRWSRSRPGVREHLVGRVRRRPWPAASTR